MIILLGKVFDAGKNLSLILYSDCLGLVYVLCQSHAILVKIDMTITSESSLMQFLSNSLHDRLL